jgi:hypothetical protein
MPNCRIPFLKGVSLKNKNLRASGWLAGLAGERVRVWERERGVANFYTSLSLSQQFPKPNQKTKPKKPKNSKEGKTRRAQVPEGGKVGLYIYTLKLGTLYVCIT